MKKEKKIYKYIEFIRNPPVWPFLSSIAIQFFHTEKKAFRPLTRQIYFILFSTLYRCLCLFCFFFFFAPALVFIHLCIDMWSLDRIDRSKTIYNVLRNFFLYADLHNIKSLDISHIFLSSLYSHTGDDA